MGMGKMDLSKFDKKLPKRERISKSVMEQPAGSEIAQYLAERARVDAMCPNVPVCIVLDGSAIIKTDTIIEDILNAFRYAPKESSQIVIPLQVVEDIAGTDACNRIANHQRHVSLERADLSLLPKECQAANSINMTLAVAAKNAAMKKLCLLISENAAMRMMAGTLGIKVFGTDEFVRKLSSYKQYWTNRRNITLGKITDNLDWGTILPLRLYSEMSSEEYENYGYLLVEETDENVTAMTAPSPQETVQALEDADDNEEIGGKISKEEFLSLPLGDNKVEYFEYCITSPQRMSSLADVYDMVCLLYSFFVARLLMEDTPDTFNTFLFRMTGRYRPLSDTPLLKCKCEGKYVYYLARRLNPPKKDGGAQVPNGTYLKAFSYFSWEGKDDDFNSGKARSEANSKPNKSFQESLDQIIGPDWTAS